MSKISKDNSQIKQYTKLLNDTKKFMENIDFCSNENIIANKMIYAKKALFIHDYNPNYNFFCQGKGCFDGDLEIKGKLIYNEKENKNDENIVSVSLNNNNNLWSGFVVKKNSENIGIYYLNKENSFIIGEESKEKILNNQTLKVNSINLFNCFSKNFIVGSSIHTSDSLGRITIDCKTLFLNGIIESDEFKVNSYKTELNSEVKITRNLNIDGDLFCNNINLNKSICTEKIKTKYIVSEEIDCLNSLNVSNICVNYDLKVKNNLILDGIFYVNSEIKFNSEIKTPLLFENLTHIPNLSCDHINKKKVSQDGDIVTTDAIQILKNKMFSDSLNMNFNNIKNLSEPEDGGDVANKNYVDKFVFGLNFLEQVRSCTYKKLEGSFINNNKQIISNKPEQLIIDSILLNINDRILVKNQENKLENGIYKVIASGNRRQQWIIQMDDDYKEIMSTNNRTNNILWVEEGNENKNILYIFNNNNNFIRFGNKNLLNEHMNITSSVILKTISFLKKKIEKIERQ